MAQIFPLFYLLWQGVLLVVLLDMTYRRRSSASMIAWFLVIFSLPYLGVLLYVLIGRRKIAETPLKAALHPVTAPNTHVSNPLETVLNRNGIPPASDGNRFVLIESGEAAFDALSEAIANAKHSVCLSTYIFKLDHAGKALAEQLAAKARSGVDVKLLIDAFGSLPLYLRDTPLQPLKDAGVSIEFFMPLRPFLRNTHINLRQHRKIYLIDDETVFSGGMNLSREYLGTREAPSRWSDLLFRIDGPSVKAYRDVFVSDWNFSSRWHKIPESAIELPERGNARIQVVPSGPDIPTDALYDALLDAIHNAKERIWIVTPYFIPDATIMSALRIAHVKGVDIRLFTPQKSDHFIFDAARSSYMREIQEWGGTVWLYPQRMLHAKAILFDDTSVVIGTLNFDLRSLFLNYEIVSIGYSAEMIEDVKQWMERLLEQTSPGIAKAGRLRKLAENLGRIIAPQL